MMANTEERIMHILELYMPKMAARAVTTLILAELSEEKQ